MKHIHNFKTFSINEQTEYAEEFFDKVQDAMKQILKGKGSQDPNGDCKNIVVQYQNNIKILIDTFIKDGTITPEVVANQIIDKYHEFSQFNNQGDLSDDESMNGVRAVNKME